MYRYLVYINDKNYAELQNFIRRYYIIIALLLRGSSVVQNWNYFLLAKSHTYRIAN